MTNTPATTALRTVKSMLRSEAAKDQLAKVAAAHMRPEKMMRVVANAVRTTPDLNDCDPMSLLGAMMTSAALGIEPNTPQGFAWLLPFKNKKKGITEAQLIIGYKGFIDLAFRSGVLTYIDAGVHYSDDELWQYEKGMNFTLRHAEGPQEGRKVHAYAIAKWQNPNGGEGTAAVVLPWSKVMKVRDGSQNWKAAVRYKRTDQSPWSTNEDQMAMKTAIRALAQSGRLPMSVEMQTAIDVDNKAMDYRSVVANGDPFPVTDSSVSDESTIEGEVVDEGAGASEPEEQSSKSAPEKKAKPTTCGKPSAKAKAEEAEALEQFERARKKADVIMADLLDAGPDKSGAVLAEHADDVEWLKANEPKVWNEVADLLEDD